METTVKTDMSSKLEDLFLKILRVVILFVLVIALIGSAIFGLIGLNGMTASPSDYKYQTPKTEELVREIKDSLNGVERKASKESASSPSKKDPEKNPKLEQEIDKQVKLLSDFLARYELNLSDAEGTRNRLLTRARTMPFEPENASKVMEYAEGQTKFFETVLVDKEILDRIQKDREILNRLLPEILDAYPRFYADQTKSAESHAAKEEGQVAMAQVGSALNLYIAAGMFCSFLLISLILVLVKIERNLRIRPV